MSLSLASASVAADDSDAARRFASVSQWQGSFEVIKAGTASGDAQGAMALVSVTIDSHSSARFTLDRDGNGWDPARGMFKWTGSGEASGHNRSAKAQWYRDGRGSETLTTSSGNTPLDGVSFSVWLPERNASFNNGFSERTFTQTTTGHAIAQVMDGTSDITLERISLDKVEPDTGRLLMPILEVLSAERVIEPINLFATAGSGPGVLTFVAELEGDQYELVEQQRPITRSRVVLYPVYEDVDVEITIAEYATWRPLGSIEKPAEPGNSIVARATLKSKTGDIDTLPPIASFSFALLDTSREPGVALNWPRDADDDDYDLRLAAVTDGAISDSRQSLVVTEMREDDNSLPYAEARIESFDFGGRASLLVKATLEDGREVIGKLKIADGEEDLVRL
ncbi:MAG: hypothetical protein HC809_03270, partial [Gammaproteobacteria bacterium]|nr:hypothetical protein [Gammaproteobacteria bacterium]